MFAELLSRVGRAALFAFWLSTPAMGQTLVWTRQIGTPSYDQANALAPDGGGGVFVAGDTRGNLAAPSAGDGDVWLAHFDSSGGQLWIRQFGTAERDWGQALAPDGAGGVFAAGSTQGDLGGGHAGSWDPWISRFSASGDQQWTRQFGSIVEDTAYALASDGVGGAFLAGRTLGSVGATNAGGSDAWLARYDADGNRLWIRQFGTSAHELGSCVAVDGTGGAYLGGITGGSLGGPNAGSPDGWITRWTSLGAIIWIRQFGSPAIDSTDMLSPDSANGVYISGHTWGSFAGPSAGVTDVWFGRIDSGGTRLWTRQQGTSELDYAGPMCPDGAGGALISASVGGAVGGPHIGGHDIYLGKFTGAGDPLWTCQVGTPSADYVYAMVPDGVGGAFVAGETSGDFGATGAGYSDAWIGRFRDNSCYMDCDASGGLAFSDFVCFQTRFALGDPYADCDGSGVRDVGDFVCFQTRFALGCP